MQAHFDVSEFVRAMGAVLPAVSDDATRPNRRGVLVRVSPDSAQFVATDGYMLAMYKAPRPRDENAPADSGDVFLPLATATALHKAAKAAARQLTAHGASQHVVTLDTYAREARTTGIALALPVYDGGFPPYETVIPKYQDEPRAADGAGASYFGVTMELVATVAACFKAAGGLVATVLPGKTALDPLMFVGNAEPTRVLRGSKRKPVPPCPLMVVLMPARCHDADADDPFTRARERAALLAADCPKLADISAPN